MLQTPRLVIKPYEESDRPAIYELLTNEQIKETYMIPDFADSSQADRLIDRLFKNAQSPCHFERGIYYEAALIGFLNDCEIDGKSIELGYVIHPKYQCRGFAAEALSASITYLFEHGFEEVKAAAFLNNTASFRVMEKCGMTPNGETGCLTYHGQEQAYRFYSLRLSR